MRKELILALILLAVPANAQNLVSHSAPAASQSHCVLLATSICKTFTDKPVMIFAGAHAMATFADTYQTEHYWSIAKNGGSFYEEDPIARPLVGHPVAYYAATAGFVVTAAWLGHKMRTSHSWVRHVWWVPQLVGYGAGVAGFTYSNLNHHTVGVPNPVSLISSQPPPAFGGIR